MKVKVVMDRPMGYIDSYGSEYPVNYGYVPGVIAGDLEEQDAYILGLDHPVDEYTGNLIAVIHRDDDVEEKWVISNQTYTKQEIYEQVKFIEQYFQSTVNLVDPASFELWDVVDENGIELGYQKLRGSKLLEHEFHKVVHVWIKQSDERFLVQKRALHKSNAPGYIAAHAGSVTAGEDVLTGAVREVEEEIGFKLHPSELKLVSTLHPKVRGKSGIDYIYLVQKDVLLKDCKIDENEVDSVMYMSIGEIYESCDNGEFYPYGDDYFKSIFKNEP
jgi:inorganic pyrophosphatase